MMRRKDQFDKNISAIERGLAIYSYVKENARNLNSSILLRVHYVMIISALDTYMHGVVEDRLIDLILENKSNPNCDYDFEFSISVIRSIFSEETKTIKINLLRNHINKILSRYSFQSPKSIERAFSYMGVRHPWKSMAKILRMDPDDIHRKLGVCVRRRNKIAHESDWNPAKMEYEEIELRDLDDCKEFVKKMVEATETIKLENN